MNKITSTLAGIAVVATVGIVPAFAQGSFSNNGVPFTFTDNGTTASVTNAVATFNPTAGGAIETGLLDLNLSGGASGFFSTVSLTFTPTVVSVLTPVITDTTFVNGALVNIVPAGPAAGTAAFSSVGKSTAGNVFNLNPGAPVPEASTVISFGALLALGGLAVLRRKSVKA